MVGFSGEARGRIAHYDLQSVVEGTARSQRCVTHHYADRFALETTFHFIGALPPQPRQVSPRPNRAVCHDIGSSYRLDHNKSPCGRTVQCVVVSEVPKPKDHKQERSPRGLTVQCPSPINYRVNVRNTVLCYFNTRLSCPLKCRRRGPMAGLSFFRVPL